MIDRRELPPCMGGIIEDKSIGQDPIPGSAGFEEIKRQMALEREKKEKEITQKRIETLEEQGKKNKNWEETLKKFDKRIRNLEHQKLSWHDFRRISSYEEISEYSEGLAVVKRDGYYGYINENYEEVIECKYDEAHDFKNRIALVKENGYYGYIDKQGKEVISCKYDEIFDFRCGLAVVKRDGYYGYINQNNKEVIECKYNDASYFNQDGKACVNQDGKIYIINNKGEIIDLKLHEDGEADKYLYDYNNSNDTKLGEFSNDLQVVKDREKYGYNDQHHYRVTTKLYDEAFPFKNGKAVVKKAGKYFYLKVFGYFRKEVEESKCCYEAASDFVENIACVKISGKLFFINEYYDIIKWDFPKKNKNIENCTDEVMYNPVFVINNEFQRMLTFFRENDKITFIKKNGIKVENHASDYGFKVVNSINTEALTYPWLFCNGIPYYTKNEYIFVINVDFEHENEKNEHNGLGLIRYIRKLFGYRYFQMILENNELKKILFENLKIESEEENESKKEKINIFIEAAKEYLVKIGEWESFLETFYKNSQILNENNQLTYKILVNDIQSENDTNTNDEEQRTEYDEIYNEIIRIAKEQKKLFDALNKLIEKTKLFGNNLEIEKILKDIFQMDMLGEANASIQYTKKRKNN